MTSGPVDLSIVVPAFNEAARIGGSLTLLHTELSAHVASWEILVVDDGSADGTAAIVERAAAGEGRIRLLRVPHRGKGAAVRAGLLAARGARRFMCDADLSMPVGEIHRFLAEVPERCDIAIGSREGLGAWRVGEPPYRHLMGRLFNGLVRVVSLSGVQDTQCGFKMFSREAAEAVIPHTTIDGWAVDIEMLFIAKRLGLRVHEIPIEWHYREQSKVSPVRDGLRMAKDVVRIRLRALAGRYDAKQP